MIKVGDRVVCVMLGKLSLGNAYSDAVKYLQLNTTYTVSYLHPYEDFIVLQEIDDLYGKMHIYHEKRFKKLSDVRQYKLKKIMRNG